MAKYIKEREYCPKCGRGIGFWDAPDESPCACKKDKVMSDGTYDSLGKSEGPIPKAVLEAKIVEKTLTPITESMGTLSSGFMKVEEVTKEFRRSVGGQITVSKMYKKGIEVGKETIEEELIDVKEFRTNPAEIDYSVRMTLNLGNYESVQVGVSCRLPAYVEEIEDAYVQAKKFVDVKLAKETAEIKEYRKSKGEKDKS
jgi:hypothetical protein